MTTSTPIERIRDTLVDAGYRSLGTPLRIATVEFDVPAALLGHGPKPDLIVIVDTVEDSRDRVVQKIEGIARALDVVRSSRPLTAVLCGPRLSLDSLDRLSKVCRALPVGTALESEPGGPVLNWLSVLLPLELPTLVQGTADPMKELRSQLGASAEDGVIAALLLKAAQGPNAVESLLKEMLEALLPGPDAQEDE